MLANFQTYERGVLCDVFVTMRKNFIVNGVSLTANTTITFYFLAVSTRG